MHPLSKALGITDTELIDKLVSQELELRTRVKNLEFAVKDGQKAASDWRRMWQEASDERDELRTKV